MVLYELVTVGCCTAMAAGLGIWPFLLRQRSLEAREELDQLTGTLAQLRRLEEVAERVGLATGQWQTAQEHASNAVSAARDIAERMNTEQRQFRDFLEQSQATRIQHLELEGAKLRRAENEWLQVTVRILDHVFALFIAAVRSGQPQLAEQIGAFQNACRDSARRVGLVAHVVQPGSPYDPESHQPLDPNAPVPEQPVVAATVGPGYTFQGQVLRRVVVALQPKAVLAATLPEVSADGVALSSQPVPQAAALASPPSDTAASGSSPGPQPFSSREAPAVSFTTSRIPDNAGNA
jgi:molecular chaperone GrpE (heat shock protein)